MKLMITICALFCITTIGKAQNETDVLRYSQLTYQASARATGMGGAMGALGADISVLSSNPAGLAWYRKSVLTLTPSMGSVEVKSLLTDKDGKIEGNEVWRETENKFGLTNIGFVKVTHNPGATIPTFNFGIAYNELASFNRNFYFKGDSKGSIVNRFQELASGQSELDVFESRVAFDAEALDRDGDGIYESDFDLYPNALITKEQVVKTSGSVKEIVVAMAGNVNEKILFGASLGLPLVSFQEEKTYKETDNGENGQGNVPVFDALSYTETLSVSGAGVNMKFGFIYRHNQALRLGAAIHTPTLYELSEDFKTTMVYEYTWDEEARIGEGESPDAAAFSYAMRTPWRFMGNAAYVIGKKGLVSADIEYVNYSKAELQYDGENEAEREANQLITNNLKSAVNIRIGGEMAMKIFRLRGGFELNQSPIEGDKTFSTAYSLGAGVRAENVFFDIAYSGKFSKETYIPYRTFAAPEQLVDNDNRVGNIVATLGFRF